MRSCVSILMAGAVVLVCPDVPAATLFVARTATTPIPGTEEQPFATLERARDEIRQRKAGGPLPAGGITVEVRGGVYELARPLELTDQDSGAENAPIVYRARQGEVVKLVGGRAVTGWKPVTDPAVLQRLDPAGPRQGVPGRPQGPRHHRPAGHQQRPDATSPTRAWRCSSRTSP